MNGVWGGLNKQKSLKDSRITVLGTGDIGTCFAKRVRGFEPAAIIGVNRSGKCPDPVYDSIYPIGNLTLDYTREKNVEIFCENLLNYAEGKPLNCVVDKQAGY